MNPYLSALNRKYPKIKPRPRRELEQYEVDLTGVFLRAREIHGHFRSGEGLLVGDDDLVGLFLLAEPALKLTLLEKDERVMAALRENAPPGAGLEIVPSDFAGVYDGKWPLSDRRFDFFVTSPPYTREGMKIWVAIGLRCLKVGGLGFIASPYDADAKADAVTLETQKFVLENGCLIEKVIPGLTIEEGLPAYQIIIRKLADVPSINWLRPLERKLYEWEEFGSQDAYQHQVK